MRADELEYTEEEIVELAWSLLLLSWHKHDDHSIAEEASVMLRSLMYERYDLRNRRAEPEPVPDGEDDPHMEIIADINTLRHENANHTRRLDALVERVATLERGDSFELHALAARLATLEQLAGYGPRAEQGFREAAERGEPSEG